MIVDQDTIFASLLFNTQAVPSAPCFPRDIMQWTETLYAPAFRAHPGFSLREHGALEPLAPLSTILSLSLCLVRGSVVCFCGG